ncbi:TetR/AcrR family transcriptional regulator [Nocardia sp. alder85J]|uniref:TetR/AcrR family transcriptional regulator n=1 Tax=Nocardia sp. alder85J TaxID=2862949 RepID=UPI001CD6062E|nr:TetR/AcrR family transcriptional regulator [Nocardia sp. alder85J]MCX4091353.1 TetR/AcrR family transcriptional regulator [Nocardia sp. alder85J]
MSEIRRGRPRSAQAQRAVLEAVRELLAAGQYEQMTMEAIAARAGVGRQTVYRWWRSRAEVVAEAALGGYLDLVPEARPLSDSGDLAADLSDWVGTLFQQLSDPANQAMIRGLAAAAADSDTDAERLYGQLTGPVRQHLTRRLTAGVAAGEVRADADVGAVADAVIGSLLYRVLTRTTTTRADAGTLIDVLLRGARAR